MTLNLETIPYLSIPQDYGGVFQFPYTTDSGENLTHFGTSNCNTCVGVYLPLSEGRCFVAHINCFIRLPNGRTTRLPRDEAEKQAIRDEVRRRLGRSAEANGWTADMIGQSGIRAVVACPNLEDYFEERVNGELPKTTAWFVVEGIRSHLGVNEQDVVCDENSTGFVVDQESGEVVLIEKGLERVLVDEGLVNVDVVKEGKMRYQERKADTADLENWKIEIVRKVEGGRVSRSDSVVNGDAVEGTGEEAEKKAYL